MTPEQLKHYRVLLHTNQGDMLVEFLPDVAPNHVRNFLDLCQSGFYVGTLFHRVSPSFMIQGGCPKTKTDDRGAWGTGRGPRMLDAEFNDTKHVRGILSMARGPSPNSASSQFFIMSADSLFLDHKYSAFGRLVSGYDTLDKIAAAKGQKRRDGTVKPTSPQRIERTIILEWTPSADSETK
ncbi:MAG TPA: peptidylprolyl isomerase [Planctomycetes bacterium]|nr:peptidylprolyl isomerase [Planctomycetota bacterium]